MYWDTYCIRWHRIDFTSIITLSSACPIQPIQWRSSDSLGTSADMKLLQFCDDTELSPGHSNFL